MLEISSSVSVFWSRFFTNKWQCLQMQCNFDINSFFPSRIHFNRISLLHRANFVVVSIRLLSDSSRKTSNIPEEHWSTSSKSKFYQVVCCMYSSIELSFIKHSVGLYWRVNILTAIKTQTIEFMIESRTKESIQSVLHARSLIWKVRPKRTWTICIHVCLFIFLYFIELGY